MTIRTKKRSTPKMTETPQTFFDYVAKHGERPAAKDLGVPYSMLRRANRGQIRPSPKVLAVAEAAGLDREGTLVEWDRRHQDYLASADYKQSVTRNARAKARRLESEAAGPEGCLGTRTLILGIQGNGKRRKGLLIDYMPDARVWCSEAPQRAVWEVVVPWPSEAVRSGDMAALVEKALADGRLVVAYGDGRRARRRKAAAA